MTFGEVKPYPEWRQLLDAVRSLRESKTQYSYDDLKELAGIDIRTERGRQQFYRFRKVALKEWNIWFENQQGFGYILIPPGEHSKAAVKRVRSARRKVVMARAINGLVKIDQLTPAQLVLHAQTGALLEDLSQAFNRTGRQLAAAASKFRLDVSEDELKLLGESHAVKK